MKPENFLSIAEQATQLTQNPGAFLTVKFGDLLNTMTIGWISIGVLWGKPVVTTMVRLSRYTFELMEKAASFTVTVPTKGMKEELKICGTQSGRDINKFTQCNLTALPAQKVSSPIIKCTGIHFECEMIYKAPINPDILNPKLLSLYPKKDFHSHYYGEIVECYSTSVHLLNMA